jgi:hypothetical protein
LGVDWIRKSEDRYKHQLQEAAHQHLKPTPLFDTDDEATITYPCHWLNEERMLDIGTLLTIYQRTDRSRIAVMAGSEAAAEIRGEAAHDLRELFRLHPEMQSCLAVFISDVRNAAEPFYVRPVARKKRTKRTVQ